MSLKKKYAANFKMYFEGKNKRKQSCNLAGEQASFPPAFLTFYWFFVSFLSITQSLSFPHLFISNPHTLIVGDFITPTLIKLDANELIPRAWEQESWPNPLLVVARS